MMVAGGAVKIRKRNESTYSYHFGIEIRPLDSSSESHCVGYVELPTSLL